MNNEELKLCKCGSQSEVGISQTEIECYVLVHCPVCKKHTDPILIPIFSLYVDGVKLEKLPSEKAIKRNQELIIEKTQEAIQTWNKEN